MKIYQRAQRLMAFSVLITSLSISPLPAVRAQAPTVRLDAILRSYWDTPNPADSNCGPGGRPLGQYAAELDGGAGATLSWINAPAGSYISECWLTEFHQVGLVAGDLVKVCTTGDFPYRDWFDSSTRWPVQFGWRTDTVWPNDNSPISDEYGGRCIAGHFGGGTTITLGYRWGWEGRYVCNNSPDCPNPHTFSYHVFIAEVNGIPIATPTPTPTETITPSPTLTPTPTPTGPTPTQTRTPTPSRTSTRLPTQTPIPIKPPPYSSSSYIALWDSAKGKLDKAALAALGRTEAISETVKGVTDAIVALHFGYPYRRGNEYGADLLVLTEKKLFFASTEDIREGAMGFVKDFCLNSSANMRLTLALGVNDSVQGIGSGHGQAWASMVEEVSKAIRNDRTLCRPFIGAPSRVSIVGAIDIEPTSLITQSIPIDVLRWTEAYSNTTRLWYYNFGTCSNCPHESPEQPHTLPSVSPLLDDVWTVSWGIPNAHPLPQIYHVNQLNAYQ